ncbi:MAG TPA: hypothetical protein VGE52_02865 [Pirellulales bacterium]
MFSVLPREPRWFALAAPVLLCHGLQAAIVSAEELHVAFDASYTVACRDVTPPEFGMERPLQKLVEARFRVTTRLMSGDLNDLQELQFEVAGEGGRLRVVDVFPHTTLVSEFVEPICNTRTVENSRTLGGAIKASIPVPIGPIAVSAGPEISGSKTHKESNSETTKRRPAQTAVIVSGTVDNEHGAFFRFRPGPDLLLEGVKEFAVIWMAPREWVADCISLRCTARGKVSKPFWNSDVQTVGGARAEIALHLGGSREGLRAAERFAAAERTWFDARATVEEAQAKSALAALLNPPSKKAERAFEDATQELAEAKKSLVSLAGPNETVYVGRTR